MNKKEKIGYFKRLKLAIFELENYIQFLSEKNGKAIGFCFKSVILFSFILVLCNIASVYVKYKSVDKYIDHMVPEFVYTDNKLEINNEQLDSADRKTVASVMKSLDGVYKDIFNGKTFTKNDLINYVNNNQKKIVSIFGLVMFIESVMYLFIFWILIGFLTSFVGWIVLGFSRIKIRYSKLYAISLYASTLTILITVIYTILNTTFGIYIEVFDYLVMLIAYIYITAVIYMIKSDLIKQQLELIKIVTVKKQIEDNSFDDKEQNDEKEPETESDTKNDKSKEKKEPGEEADEPDGSEI